MKYRAILILFFVLTLPLLSSEPKTVKLTFSPETTYLMEPQLPDGRIDYIAALNKQLAAQTTPENNLIAGIFPLVPGEVKEFLTWADTTEEELPKAIQKYRERFGKMLGLGAVTPPLNAPIWFGPVSAFTEDSEKELLEFYTKEELAAMSEKCRELDKNHYKSRLDEGKITQEKYDTEIKRIETETTEKFYRCILGKQFQESLRHPWTAKEYPYIAKWLASTDEQGEKLMDIIRQRTGYYHPLLSHDEDSNLMYAVMFPYLQSLRSMARYFNCRGNFEFARGHFDQAMECAFASVRLGQTIRPGSSTIVEDLVGIATIGVGHGQLTTYLANLPKEKDTTWILQKK
ncbi:MAG: hypothetical protein FWE67_15705, partial [Planctomycetaceae bacterium]|nr:hypothetical protein [Planctomycetaceae bacterium]